MFNGSVSFVAKIKGNGLTFPSFDFNPYEPGVDRVALEGPKGDEIQGVVQLTSVATPDDGRALAKIVMTAALNRIAFFRQIAIENARSVGDEFVPANPQPGVHAIAVSSHVFFTDEATLVVGVSAADLKADLERPSPPGERNFSLFRSARQSTGPVEEFMHLYNILLMLHNDLQADVDAFIVGEDPAVPQTQHPQRRAGVMETIYTRLRNELAHRRAGVHLDVTKADMASRLGNLLALTKRAIELHS